MTETSNEPFLIWTVYNRPSDYPEGYQARLFEVYPGEFRVTGHSMQGLGEIGLRLIRNFLASQGFVQMMRSPEDDPEILESWI